jgi:hypothetical protein
MECTTEKHGGVTMSMTPGRTGSGASDDPGRDVATGSEEAARLPSLEEQTPGLDRAQEEKTLQDARAFYGAQGSADDSDDNNDALMSEQDIQESGERHS